MAIHFCKQCGERVGGLTSPAPDDCFYCGYPVRWANRIDGKNKLKQFWKMYEARETEKRQAAYRERFGDLDFTNRNIQLPDF